MNATIGIIIYLLAMISIAGLVIWTGNRNAKIFRFEFMYMNLQTMLRDPLRPINRTSWKYLNECFDEIEKLYKVNPEKVDVLRGEFLKLYEPVIDEIDLELKEMNSEEEYDPGQIFSEFNHT